MNFTGDRGHDRREKIVIYLLCHTKKQSLAIFELCATLFLGAEQVHILKTWVKHILRRQVIIFAFEFPKIGVPHTE